MLMAQAQPAWHLVNNNAAQLDTPAPHPCIFTPTEPSCSQYAYPLTAAAEDILSLCSSMPFMAACSILMACNASAAGPDTWIFSSLSSNGTQSVLANGTANGDPLALSGNNSSSSGEAVSNSSGVGLVPGNSGGGQNVSANNSQICNPWQLVVTVCGLDTGMGNMSGEQCTTQPLQSDCLQTVN